MRTLAWVGFIGTAVLTFLYAMLPSVQMCYVLFGGMGLTSILIWWGTRFKVIRLCCEEDEYPARIGVSYSIYGVTGLVVGVINAAIIAAIPDTIFAMQSVIIFLGVLITVLGVLSFVFIPDFKGEINKDAKLFSVADAAEAIKTPGVLWACLGYFCVYCVYQGATYTTPYLSQAMGTDANTVNIIGLIRTYGIGLLAGPVIGAIAAKAKSSKTIIGCFALAIVVLGAFIVMPQDSGLSIVACCLVVVFGFATYGAFSIGSSPLSELGIPMRIFGTAAGILSVIGFLPDVFIHTWYGSLIDASGVAAFNQIFGFEIMFAVLGIIFLVNAVNLTDGLDGLCTGVTFVSMIGYLLAGSLLGFVHVSLIAAATAGACAGFLVWNFYPAKVFMGDTGSMFFGGIVTALAFVMQRPELVLFFGIVYIWDAMTVVIQRTYFKATHGKRIFRMTPIHHAFEMRGWREVKIDGFFALIAVIGVAMGIFYICVA